MTYAAFLPAASRRQVFLQFFVAQMMGHSGPGVLQIYARAIDEYRRSAISKLEALRENQRVQLASGEQRLIQ